MKIQTYENLLTSLRKDSAELVRVIEMQSKSLKYQNAVINTSISELTDSISIQEITDVVYAIFNGAYSFFPKYGTYNSIVANNRLDIIDSENIKSNLIDLYDYWCYRYENVDNVLDPKYHNELYPFLQKQMGFFVNPEFEYGVIQIDRLETNYSEFQLHCQNLSTLTNHSVRQLTNIQNYINDLISEINEEL